MTQNMPTESKIKFRDAYENIRANFKFIVVIDISNKDRKRDLFFI